uniref:hypothetical protein n=1 Tax=Escherichia coli TaxID=562 RepID=UPI0015E85448|nr:hypothetical protein [Escherichia coli]
MTLEKLYNKDALLPEDTIIIDHHLSTINPHQIPITKVNLVIDYINAELLYNLVDEKTHQKPRIAIGAINEPTAKNISSIYHNRHFPHRSDGLCVIFPPEPQNPTSLSQKTAQDRSCNSQAMNCYAPN